MIKLTDIIREMKVNRPKINHVDDNGLKQGYWEYYFDDGTVHSKGFYKNGKYEGIWKFYWEDGNLFHTGLYVNDKKEGIWEMYYKDGQLWSEGSYKGGKMDGLWKSYYNNGQLDKNGSFKNSKAEGVWEYYNEDGSLKRKELYNNDEVVKELPLDEMKVNAPSAFIEEENTKIDPIILAFLKYWVDEEYWGEYTSLKDVYEFALENDYVDGDEISFEDFSNQMKPYIRRIIALGDADSMAYLVVKPGGVMGVSEESMGDHDGNFDLLNKQMREKALKYLNKK